MQRHKLQGLRAGACVNRQPAAIQSAKPQHACVLPHCTLRARLVPKQKGTLGAQSSLCETSHTQEAMKAA